MDPIEFLVENRDQITTFSKIYAHSPKKTWDALVESTDIEKHLTLDLFETHFKLLVALVEACNKQREIAVAQAVFVEEIEEKRRIEKIKEQKQILGWGIQTFKKGEYYRLYKKVKGKTEWIYIGKKLDREKCRKKIEEKEKALGIWKPGRHS